jgi:dipeptidyl aminopeptidase/acylaminoacyl peptidase
MGYVAPRNCGSPSGNTAAHRLRPAEYEKFNPVDHVSKWKVPMLVVQGQLDYPHSGRTRASPTFTALQRRGIDSKFLYFPDENHWVLKPANSKQWHQTVLAWLERWTK